MDKQKMRRSVAKAGLAFNLWDGKARSHTLCRSLGRKSWKLKEMEKHLLHSQLTWGKANLSWPCLGVAIEARHRQWLQQSSRPKAPAICQPFLVGDYEGHSFNSNWMEPNVLNFQAHVDKLSWQKQVVPWTCRSIDNLHQEPPRHLPLQKKIVGKSPAWPRTEWTQWHDERLRGKNGSDGQKDNHVKERKFSLTAIPPSTW